MTKKRRNKENQNFFFFDLKFNFKNVEKKTILDNLTENLKIGFFKKLRSPKKIYYFDSSHCHSVIFNGSEISKI
jgi:hypothetical protein